MTGRNRQLTGNGQATSSAVARGAARSGRAVTTATTAPASGDLLADGGTPCEAEDCLERLPKPNVVALASPMTSATKRLLRPAGRTARSSSGEPQDAHTQALSQVKNHVAKTLHETVMQTLVATIYLAESPETSRRDMVECLRQATHELRCVTDGLAALEAGSWTPEAS